jgi:hypothetical protein
MKSTAAPFSATHRLAPLLPKIVWCQTLALIFIVIAWQRTSSTVSVSNGLCPHPLHVPREPEPSTDAFVPPGESLSVETLLETPPSSDPKLELRLASDSLARLGWSNQEISLALEARMRTKLGMKPSQYWESNYALHQDRNAATEIAVRAEMDTDLIALGLPTKAERDLVYVADERERQLAADIMRRHAESVAKSGLIRTDSSPDEGFAEEQLLEELQSQVSPATLRAIELQTSKLSDRLRALPGMQWDADAFAKVFDIEDRYERSTAPVSSSADEQRQERERELKEALGAEGYKQYLRSQDAHYEAIQYWGGKREVPETTLGWLYDVGQYLGMLQGDESSSTQAAIERHRAWQMIETHLGTDLARRFVEGPGSSFLEPQAP